MLGESPDESVEELCSRQIAACLVAERLEDDRHLNSLDQSLCDPEVVRLVNEGDIDAAIRLANKQLCDIEIALSRHELLPAASYLSREGAVMAAIKSGDTNLARVLTDQFSNEEGAVESLRTRLRELLDGIEDSV